MGSFGMEERNTILRRASVINRFQTQLVLRGKEVKCERGRRYSTHHEGVLNDWISRTCRAGTPLVVSKATKSPR